ncbi:MAG: bifunctional hydroxymethylpyrimidine kinase/phosphomethylpyrimidine kinase [Thermodesulfobacteriota bacterium]|nr:bifunctional hydroxymethylpyrimidine kinase/phosphomethylpyrimidine kinase [Thermodesulfobacteriota bacterium]
MTTKRYHRVLTIAGSDSSGGAGIQADLKTFSALGCYGMSAITALTAQNTKGVTAVHAVPPSFVEQQLEAVFGDIGVDATKIGMLYSGEIIETVARQLKKHDAQNIVLDPVMVSQNGDKLLKDEAIEAIKKYLMPLATILTPNLPEASVLLNRRVNDPRDIRQAAREIASYGSRSVLLKGGHMDSDDCTDLLFIRPGSRFVAFKGQRIDTRNNHGTGCALSSAIASFLARGLPLDEAAGSAKEYITGAVRAGSEYEIGHGHGPVHHYYRFW